VASIAFLGKVEKLENKNPKAVKMAVNLIYARDKSVKK
jgi:hypothetical protein